MSRSKKSLKKQLEEPFDPEALKDGYTCPICKGAFRNQYACVHSLNDVIKFNTRRRRQMEEQRQREIIDEQTAARESSFADERAVSLNEAQLRLLLYGVNACRFPYHGTSETQRWKIEKKVDELIENIFDVMSFEGPVRSGDTDV